ncbi:tyrosine--tRNA ligase [Candidatus Parcubacteria bacterium]|nr:tyrosine--tRNA ligase [Candidatus Parcubacteria bacterium]
MKTDTDPQKIEQLLTRGVEHIYPSPAFLEARLKEGKPLSLYVGIDPTSPDLHIGHSIVLRKMREFQQLGHTIILLIGDFTGMIGDPSDKSAARVRLTREQVLKNAETYTQQASKLISFEGKNPAQLRYNSTWWGQLTAEQMLELAANFTVQQMLERDMFEKRMAEAKPIYLHEFFYPLLQGYDCVAMDVNGEIGGNDQTFNMLAGRTLLKTLKNKEKFVITMKLLADPTGKKMGKSEGNMIRMGDSADEMFGKVMSWTDGMIVGGFELLTDVPDEDIAAISKSLIREEVNPRDLKARLAREVVRGFHSTGEAAAASDRFDQLFREHEQPTDVPEHRVTGPTPIVQVLVETGLAKSKTDARRLIEGGGVKVDETVVEDVEMHIKPGKNGVLIQKGKRHFVRVR